MNLSTAFTVAVLVIVAGGGIFLLAVDPADADRGSSEIHAAGSAEPDAGAMDEAKTVRYLAVAAVLFVGMFILHRMYEYE